MIRAAAVALVATLGACAVYRDTSVPMAPVAQLDLSRYGGTWYEIARFPVRFQQGCTATTATYAPLAPDRVSVLNTCRDGTPDGPVRQIAGTAQVVGPGQLRVRLGAIPFGAPYWVLWVAPDYSAAVVGVPQGSAGWILARGPQMPATQRAQAEAALTRNGYDVTRLIEVEHGQ
jgi:apolipoprotein D and lipocalin family protein